MKNFWKKYKIQAIIAGYFLLLGIFIYGGIFTAINNIKNGVDEIQKKIIDNEIDKKNLNKIPQLVGDYEIFSSQKNNLNMILEKESEIEFIQSLEELAKETGNKISLKLIEEEGSQVKDVKEKTKTEEKNKKDIKSDLPYENYVVIQLELEGEYPGLVRFLKKLENMDYFVNIVAFDLKKEENQIEEKSDNPFVSSDNSEKKEKETSQKKEILKSLIDLIVYIR